MQGQFIVVIPIPLHGVFEIRLSGWNFQVWAQLRPREIIQSTGVRTRQVAVAVTEPRQNTAGNGLIGLELAECKSSLRSLDLEMFNGGINGGARIFLVFFLQQTLFLPL